MGGLRTTALDYASFLVEVIAPRAVAPYRLSAKFRDEMFRPQVQVDASKLWALGWEIQRTPRGIPVQHQGGRGGFQAFAAASLIPSVCSSVSRVRVRDRASSWSARPRARRSA